MTDNLIEIYLPDIDVIHTFNNKNIKEKTKIIELGLKMYQTGSLQLNNINDDEKKKEIDNLINSYEEKILKYKKLQEDQCNNFEKRLENVKNEIEISVKKLSEKEIQSMSQTISNLTNNLNLKTEELNKVNSEKWKQIRDSENKIRSDLEEKYEAKIKIYEDRLEIENKKHNELIKRKQNSALIGQDGEIYLEGSLNMLFPKIEVESTGQQSNRGDFILKFNEWIMVECKEYSHNVLKKEIEKFYRDITINKDIKGGIFCSLKTGICARNDFQLEIIDNKPIIFICQLKKNINKIKIAVDVLKTLMNVENNVLSDKEKCDKLNNIIRDFKKDQKKARKIVIDQHTKLMKVFDNTDSLVKSLASVLK